MTTTYLDSEILKTALNRQHSLGIVFLTGNPVSVYLMDNLYLNQSVLQVYLEFKLNDKIKMTAVSTWWINMSRDYSKKRGFNLPRYSNISLCLNLWFLKWWHDIYLKILENRTKLIGQNQPKTKTIRFEINR